MINMRISVPDEIERQKELWRLSFEDDDSYIDYYYSHFYKPERVFVLEEDGELKSMLATFPLTVHLPDNTECRAVYVYALCTDPKDRKRGLGRQLLAYTEEYAKAHGVDAVALVPTDMTLFLYYFVMGYRKCFAHRRVEVPRNQLPPLPEHGSIHPVDAHRYNEVRDQVLKGSFFVSYDDEMIEQQRGISRLSKADIYEIEVDGVHGVAAVEYLHHAGPVMKELVIPDEKVEAAVALVAKEFPAESYFVRIPITKDAILGSYYQTFGVIKWFREELEKRWGTNTNGYLGIAFD